MKMVCPFYSVIFYKRSRRIYLIFGMIKKYLLFLAKKEKCNVASIEFFLSGDRRLNYLNFYDKKPLMNVFLRGFGSEDFRKNQCLCR